MNVASMRTRLCRQMGHTIAADNISTPVVTLRECQLDLWPTRDIVGSKANFKWEVPYDSSICLLALICMLADAAFVTLENKQMISILH